jgi:hypothetical protein
MSQLKKIQDILAMYRKHGWRLARVLARAETLAEMRGAGVCLEESATHALEESASSSSSATDAEGIAGSFEGAALSEATVDAMWFTRPSQAGRDAWELRLVGEPPYALFELFEPDEAEEDREDVRREMEARLREYAAPRSGAEAAPQDEAFEE